MATLKINRGTTYSLSVTYSRGGVAQSFDGAVVRFTMKSVEFSDAVDDSDAVLKFDIDDAEGEEAVINLIPSDTAELAPGTYFYDVKVQESGGDIYKLDEGQVKLDGSPTNRRV
jgi:hypothetical protein